jgi:hypothetical protein
MLTIEPIGCIGTLRRARFAQTLAERFRQTDVGGYVGKGSERQETPAIPMLISGWSIRLDARDRLCLTISSRQGPMR